MHHPISQDVFVFLRELAANNTRDWFQANKSRYEAMLLHPVQQFVRDMAAPLTQVSPELVASAALQGGSLYRIYRDTRFSPDKRPYKTHAGIHFYHRLSKGPAANKAVAPGLYMHLEPGASFMALGMHCSTASQLKPVREAIVKHPDQWEVLKRTLAAQGQTLGGETLRGVPRGFDKTHPFIEDIRRQDYYVHEDLAEEDVCAPSFPQRLLDFGRQTSPLGAFLARSQGLPW